MSWTEVVGHDWAVDVLAAAITHDRVGHAYLFTGPAQIGKTTLALKFAQALNCSSTAARPCGTCRSCNLIASGRHPDVTHIEPTISARGKASIKIEQMRDLQRSLQLAAYEGPYKVAIISGFEAANVNAANAFLKTLEEPPSNTVLLLTTTDGDMLLDTIKSRCRVVSMRPVSAEKIAQTLLTNQANAEQAHQLAHIANGRIGWAIAAVTDASILQLRLDELTKLSSILEQPIVARFKSAELLAKKPEALANTLNVWLTWWRDLLMVSSGLADQSVINIDQFDVLAARANAWSDSEVKTSLDATMTALWQLERNVNIRLALENLLLTYPTLVTA